MVHKAGTQMVCALGTPKRHPESGIYWFRKRVPGRLRAKVGKSEIKFSLRTRNPDIARLRNLEALIDVERAWAAYDFTIVDAASCCVVPIECKSTSIAPSMVAARPSLESLPPVSPTRSNEEKMPGADATLRAIFKSYAAEAELAPAIVKRWTPVVARFVAYLGHDEPQRIRRSNVVGWKDALLKDNKSNITVRDVYLAANLRPLPCEGIDIWQNQ